MPRPDSAAAPYDMLILTLVMGVVFCAVHLFNGWALRGIEFSEHINLVYLPGFLRLVHVLILGMVWGTAATAVGGVLLLFWSHDGWLVGLANIGVSASVAMLAVLLMQVLHGRRVALTRLSDLIQLALLYALLNAALHHLVWSWLDPSHLVQPAGQPLRGQVLEHTGLPAKHAHARGAVLRWCVGLGLERHHEHLVQTIAVDVLRVQITHGVVLTAIAVIAERARQRGRAKEAVAGIE